MPNINCHWCELTEHEIKKNCFLSRTGDKAIDNVWTGKSFAFVHFFYLISKKPQLKNSKSRFRGQSKKHICLKSWLLQALGTHNRFCFSAKTDGITRNSDSMARVAHHVKMKMLTDWFSNHYSTFFLWFFFWLFAEWLEIFQY